MHIGSMLNNLCFQSFTMLCQMQAVWMLVCMYGQQ